MRYSKIWRWFILLTLSVGIFMVFDVVVKASPVPPDSLAQTDVSKTSGARSTDPMQLQAAGSTIEVFTNTWSYSTLGMVYDPTRDHIRYAHESQSNAHNPTVYDVEYSTPHTVVNSFALSSLNTGWPWELDNRTGAGYDIDTDTYFMPDYNGDLANADDNIVEIDVSGTILNAWEMDDEIGSNDSADGSEIDSIIDIAVVSDSPTRYFATAAYDGSIVYEIVLTKTGTLWTPNSWTTVATYTLSNLTDNLGIDYDAQNDRLYHSGWNTTTILVTDLDMNPIDTFDCPGAGGYNSGVAFVEGSNPPEVWVTDFSSDQTTRCEAIASIPVPITWDKWIEGTPWDPHLTYTYEMSDTLEVVDVITAAEPVQLMERWNPQHLRLMSFSTEPPVGVIVTGTHFLEWNLPPAPDVMTMTKFFHVEPSTWTTTLLSETLRLLDGTLEDAKPVTIEKEAPILLLSSVHPPEVTADSVTTYTLTYENAGGYENDVEVHAHFPITAPFAHAVPYPTHVTGDRRMAVWELGDLANGTLDQIEVFVEIVPTVQPSQTVEIRNIILNHVDEIKDDALVSYHIEEPPPVQWMWEKLVTVDGIPWYPGISVTLETSDTLQIVDVITASGDAELPEFWDDAHLELVGVDFDTGIVEPGPGRLIWRVPGGSPVPVAITKTFHVRDCTWLDTVLWEELWVEGLEVGQRPVGIMKRLSNLWIDSAYDPGVDPGGLATFVLNYGNTGGFESAASILNTFPTEAVYVGSEADPPVPVNADPQGLWAEWDIGSLADGDTGTITVTVEVPPDLPPGPLPPIYDYIYDHAGIERDWTEIAYHVRPPRWEKRINGVAWYPGISITTETSDTFTVVDVITGNFNTVLREFWNPERLELMAREKSAGTLVPIDDYAMEWVVPAGAAPVVTLTKTFHVRDCAWTYTPIHEELWIEGDLWHERPFVVQKLPSELQLGTAYEPKVRSGTRITYTLYYTNVGAPESGAWLTSTFPVSAPFVNAVSDPPLAQEADSQGRWAKWSIGELGRNEGGTVTISVLLTDTLQASEVITIHNYAYDHVDIERFWEPLALTVQYNVYLPLVVRND